MPVTNRISTFFCRGSQTKPSFKPLESWGRSNIYLDIQNPPVIPGEDRCLEPLKAEPQEMVGGSNTSSIGVWMSRVYSG